MQKMGYEVSDQPNLKRYTKLGERRKRRKVDMSASKVRTSSEQNVSAIVGVHTTEVSCQTDSMGVATVDVACQTDAEEIERIKEDHKLIQTKMNIHVYEKALLSEESLKSNEHSVY